MTKSPKMRAPRSGPPDAHAGGRAPRGVISTFVRHPTLPNLLMAMIIMVGLFSLLRLNRQFFPNIEIPSISVTVPWTGASAEDVATNILDVLEPELRFLDDVSEVTSIARDGTAVISIEFYAHAELQKAQSDIEQAISRITTLPEDSERPIIARSKMYDPVAKIAISGPFSEKVLNTYAKELRDALLAGGIDRISMSGERDEEIWIELNEFELRRLGLTLETVAQRIRDNTQDLPSGKLEGEVDVQLRSRSERRSPESIGEIEIKSAAGGEKVLLKDIAKINTQFEREGKIGLIRGNPAIELNVQRALSADTLETMRIAQDVIDTKRATLPESLDIDVYDIRGKFVTQRLGILINNGLQGLVLVLAMLFIFLNARIAFWVAAGIPVALLAALSVMYLSGQSINMISMFALIMMLGIIVDDAIVVGEQAATLEQQGLDSLTAAESGALTMFPPVIAATITTMAAFLPIFFVGDRIGQIMVAIPLVVVAVLIASTVECFLILPGHLRHGGKRARKTSKPRQMFDARFAKLRDGAFSRFVTLTYAWRYTTVAALVASFILAVGMLAGGRVGFQFFPSPESENLRATVEFAPGTPKPDQAKAVGKLLVALDQVESKLLANLKEKDETKLVEASFAVLGQAQRSQGDNLAEINVQLTPSEQRSIATKKVIRAWREALPQIPGVERVAIAGRRGGPPGRDVDVRLQDAPTEVLKKAADDVKEALTAFPGVSAIGDDLPYGKQEYVFSLTPRGHALGFTGASIGRQVRNAFDGAVATRFARDDEEITVRVMRKQSLSGRQDLEQLYLTGPTGARVPLTEAVTIEERQSFSIVQRKDGVTTVGVTGDIDADVSSTQEVVARLEAEVMPDIAEKYGLRYSFKGRADETQKSFKDLQQGALLALGIIYIVLGIVFGSYWKPLAVMAIIPFGFVGALIGHYVMGYALTIISLIGLLGLSGILVNDSIVLVSRIKQRLGEGDNLEEATIGASRDRFRAVLLTSLTTIGGLTPLLFETSRQAQFLIPMAVTLVFGLAAATILVLVLVPALVGIGGDIGQAAGKLRRLLTGADKHGARADVAAAE